MEYNRQIFENVVVYHWPNSTSGCGGCGWAELGESFAGHVADVYEFVMQNLSELTVVRVVRWDEKAKALYINAGQGPVPYGGR